MKVTRTERGWAGHFICSSRCLFRRNTLLECEDGQIVVSTVGLMRSLDEQSFDAIGIDRYFETMAFHANPKDTRYHDADVTRQVHFDSPWCIDEADADDKANEMHEMVVAELTQKLKAGVVLTTSSL